MLKRVVVAGWALVGMLCAPAQAQVPERVPAKVLHAFLSTGETGLDPAVASDVASLSLLENLFDPLLRYDYTGAPVKLQPNTLTAMPEVTDGARPTPSTCARTSTSRRIPPSRGKRQVTARIMSTASSACTTPR
jgi:ABC-type oligopeptide transport system substrate-binding subunit